MTYQARTFQLILVAVILLLFAFVTWFQSVDHTRPLPIEPVERPPGPVDLDNTYAEGNAQFVGSRNCRDCHEQQYEKWQGSHHDLAMDIATEQTVLGDFDNATFTHQGVTSQFFRRNGRFIVHTEGRDGRYNDYTVSYVFGHTPLQQYLVAFPDGRLQCLPLSWDSRAEDQGGGRWFHLHGDQRISPDDQQFWTRPAQNWNFMCAHCHSTNLKKNYIADQRHYRTTFAEIDVACEACHGPGSEHVRWALAHQDEHAVESDDDLGLLVRLKDTRPGEWIIDPDTDRPRRSKPPMSENQLETCARCHSHHTRLSEYVLFDKPLHDMLQVSVLEPDLYHADGQLRDLAYVYGSFLQSRMYHRGVQCTDCHDPHGLTLYAPAGRVCLNCHQADIYDTEKHHFHEPGGPGSDCTHCHMIERTFMTVDAQRDHSFRVPRPDLSVELGTPNACSDCHHDQSFEWAANSLRQWYGDAPADPPHYATLIRMGREGNPRSVGPLTTLIADPSRPAIVRATALKLVRQWVTPAVANIIIKALDDHDPIVRVQAVSALESLPPADRRKVVARMLTDPIKAVRIEAARVLAVSDKNDISGEYEQIYRKVLAEYIDVQQNRAERGSSHLNLGLLYIQLGEFEKAEVAYKQAIELEPLFIPAYINLADLYRLQKRESEAEAVLRAAVALMPDNPDGYYALGLSLVRQQRMAEALTMLAAAAQQDQGHAHYHYAYGLALYSTGHAGEAIEVLEAAHENYPYDAQILLTLATYLQEQGQPARANKYTARLQALYPDNPQLKTLLEELNNYR